MASDIGKSCARRSQSQHGITNGGGAFCAKTAIRKFVIFGKDISLRHRAFGPATRMHGAGFQDSSIGKRDLHIGITPLRECGVVDVAFLNTDPANHCGDARVRQPGTGNMLQPDATMNGLHRDCKGH